MAKKNKEKVPIVLQGQELEEIISQSCFEYDHSLQYRNQREQEWQKIDDLYFGRKPQSLITRANIHVPKMQGTIETFLSKVDDPVIIEYEAVSEGDRPKEMKLNALIKRDMKRGHWKIKDLLGKKEGALYGRTIYKKWSTNIKGKFEDHLDVMDVLDYLIDPLAGGLIPMEKAAYMGHDNIIKSKWDMLDASQYDQKAVSELAGKVQSDTDDDNRYRSKTTRRAALGLTRAVYKSEDSLVLVEWYTHFKGKRYQVLFSRTAKTAVRVQLLKTLFSSDEFPFATWAPFPRLFEFWTPGLGEMIKEPNIIQNIILSQILDNNAFRNYGMKAYDSRKVSNPAMLNPKPMGKIPVQGNPNEIIMDIKYPALDNALQVYNMVEKIYAGETGVTGQAKGVPNTKRMSATEFAGLLDEVSDRFFTSNELYSMALSRLAELYYYGIEDNLIQKERVRILGPQGYEWDEVSNKDVKGEYDVLIRSGAAEEANKNIQRDRFRDYIRDNRKNERLNQKFLDEKEAQMVGFKEDEIQRLTNPDLEGDWIILAEAAAENETMLSKDHKPNPGATQGHIQKHLDFANKTEGLSLKVRERIMVHAKAEVDIAIKNADRKAKTMIQEAVTKSQEGTIAGLPAGAGPIVPQNLPADVTIPGAELPIPGAGPDLPPIGGPPALPPADNFIEETRFEAIRGAPPNR